MFFVVTSGDEAGGMPVNGIEFDVAWFTVGAVVVRMEPGSSGVTTPPGG